MNLFQIQIDKFPVLVVIWWEMSILLLELLLQSVGKQESKPSGMAQHGSYLWSSDVYVLLQENELWHS